MARVQVLYWQEIPSVVRVGDVKRQLPEWFQQEIDRVAMEHGLLGSDAYLEHWEWRDLGDRDGDPAVIADEVEAELVAGYPGSRPS
ncbi:MAG TPA: virulence factor [Gaiellaceae bacterium]|nr:virulence factor [Gaiellaceae bacterium]